MIKLKVCPFDENIGVLYQSNGYYGLIAHHLIKGYKTSYGAYEFLRKRYMQYRNELKDANNLSSNILSIGQLLKIPTQEQETTTSDTYIVKSGDSLYSIAQKYGVDVYKLIEANGGSNVLVGQVISLN